MVTRRRFVGLLLCLSPSLLLLTPAAPPEQQAARSAVPTRLPDSEFWRLSNTLSEVGGTFHSENYVSNEGLYQRVIPQLLRVTKPGGVYIGVGPEQNFTYIAALRPDMAFIVDFRRGNLREHLLYKALMEMSSDRVDFLSRLFARRKPSGLDTRSTVDELFYAFHGEQANEELARRTTADIRAWLIDRHRLPIPAADMQAIEFIHRTAFVAEGPNVAYSRTDGGFFRGPTYAMLMTRDDGTGQKRSYLATEDGFQFLKQLQSRNLIVPVVGDLGGTKALRGIAGYTRRVGGRVSAFYVSNVEQYLRREAGKMEAFCGNVARLPLDASSTLIRSVAGAGGGGEPNNLAFFGSQLASMQTEIRACAER